MPWSDFDGKPYTREQFAAYVGTLRWRADRWKPLGITLHNTASPTLAQWVEEGERHGARIRNLQSYYENNLGWHAGPHLFISRNFINGFSNILKPGVHSRCYNPTHIGIEMVGDYNSEEFDSGDGSLVRDNAVFAMAHLYRALKLKPSGLVFHKECRRDNHDCPGRNVQKADVIRRVVDCIRTLDGVDEPPQPETGEVASSDGTLNLRASAGVQSTIISILRNGDKVDLLDETVVGSTKWLYVRAEDGQTGWAAARYVEIA
jgi:Bacterial SH3 domain/N-acetylmuramoyl-L-alanine amidase